MSAKSLKRKQVSKRAPLSDIINNNNITKMPPKATKMSSTKPKDVVSKNEEQIHVPRTRSRKQISSLPSIHPENASSQGRQPVKSAVQIKDLRIPLNNNYANGSKVSVTEPYDTNLLGTRRSKSNIVIVPEESPALNTENTNRKQVIVNPRNKKAASSKSKSITTKDEGKNNTLEPNKKSFPNGNVLKNNSALSSNKYPNNVSTDLKTVETRDEDQQNKVIVRTRSKRVAENTAKIVITSEENIEVLKEPEAPVVNVQTAAPQNKNCIPEKSLACTPLISRLRKCEKKNYVESSPESSVCGVPITKPKVFEDRNLKVPIYKQIISNKTNNRKQKNDIYEFDEFDTENKNKRDRKDSVYYDKTTHEILQRLENNEKKQLTKRKVGLRINPRKGAKKKTQKLLSPKYKEKMDLVISKVMGNIKRKDNAPPIENVKKINIIGNVLLSPSRSENCDDWCERPDSPELENGNQTCDHPDSPIFENHQNVCNDNISNFFGFCDNSSSPKTKRDLNAHVDKSGIPEMFTPRRCNANSTMLLNRELPWRSVEYKRNPHFILLKPNALPCLKQEPVIEHSFVEPFEERCSKIDVTTDITRNQVQTSILDYVNTSDCNASQVDQNIPRSLYDYEEFNEKPLSRRRRILGVLQSSQFISTPKKDAPLKVISPDISLINSSDDAPFYGFDNSVEMDKENINIRKASPAKSVVNTVDDSKSLFGFEKSSVLNVEHSPRQTIEKPFRANVKFKNCVINNEIEEVNSVDKEISISIMDNEDLEVIETDKDVQLFEDPEAEFHNVDMSITIPNIKYERKRRKRLNSQDSEYSEPEKPKKKKKDEMTKAEQAEFDKWAQQFNAMCAEVQQYELDIE